MSFIETKGMADDSGEGENAAILDGAYQDVEFLRVFPLISPARVLSYFATTPFFDPMSNNQELIRQGIDQTLENLQGFVGLEYIVDEKASKPPHLFVIAKQHRHSPNSVDALDLYYCFDGFVMRCTNFQEVLNARFAKVTCALEKVMEAFNS